MLERAKSMLVSQIHQNNMEPCIKIVQAGFPINDPIIDCEITILMHVSAMCTKESVQQILALSPDVNKRDSIGRTALHYACRAGKMENVQVLMENDEIDVDAVTNAGVSPLMTAVESGNI